MVQLVERVERQIDLAPHLKNLRRPDQGLRNDIDRLDVLGDVFADLAVSTRRTLHEDAILIANREGQTVDLQLTAVAVRNSLERSHQAGLPGFDLLGRLDIVENRYVGMKSRGCYETPGGTIMLRAHRAIESLTLDREVAHLKDELMPRYASLIYNGYWFSPEREMMQKMIDASQASVNGVVRIKLYKGNVGVVGRKSESDSLFDESIATFEDDAGAYHQGDAEGFIKLNALRMRIAAKKHLR